MKATALITLIAIVMACALIWSDLASRAPDWSSQGAEAGPRTAQRSTFAAMWPAQPSKTPPRCPVKGVPGSVLWDFEAGAKIGSAPALSEDGTHAYIGTGRSSPAVFDVGCDGALVWRFDYGEGRHPAERPQSFEASPAVGDDGTVYIGDDVVVPNFFFAIKPDGRLHWVYQTMAVNSDMDVSPALDTQGRAFTGSSSLTTGGMGGSIIALTAEGQPMPGYPWGDSPIDVAPVALAGDRVVYVSSGGYAHVYRTPTPTPTRTGSETPFPSLVAPSATPAASVSETPEVSGTVTTSIPTDTPTASRTASPSSTPVALPTQPSSGMIALVPIAISGGDLHQARRSPGRGLNRLNPPAQRRSENFPVRLHLISGGGTPPAPVDVAMEREVSSVAAVGDIVIFWIGGGSSMLVAYDIGPPTTRLWEYETQHELVGAPLLGRRNVSSSTLEIYFLDSSGNVFALDASTDVGVPPALRWTATVPAPARSSGGAPMRYPQSPALGDAGLLYVASGSDSTAGHPPQITALRTSNGLIEWSAALGANVPSTAVTVAPGGVLYFGAGSRLIAVSTESSGLDSKAVWPGWRRDARNTGRAER